MSIHCFTVRAVQPEPAQTELNEFLASQRVVSLRREFVSDGADSFWAFCLKVAEGPGPLPGALRANLQSAGRAAGGGAADRPDNHRGKDWLDDGFRLLLSPRARAVAPRTRQRPDLRGRASKTRCVGKLQRPWGAGRAVAEGPAPNAPGVFRLGVLAW